MKESQDSWFQSARKKVRKLHEKAKNQSSGSFTHFFQNIIPDLAPEKEKFFSTTSSKCTYQLEKTSDNFLKIIGKITEEDFPQLKKKLSLYSYQGIEMDSLDTSMSTLQNLEHYLEEQNILICNHHKLEEMEKIESLTMHQQDSYGKTTIRFVKTPQAGQDLTPTGCQVLTNLDLAEDYCLIRVSGRGDRGELDYMLKAFRRINDYATRLQVPIILILEDLDLDSSGMNGLSAIILELQTQAFLVGVPPIMSELFRFYDMETCFVYKNSLEEAIRGVRKKEAPHRQLDEETQKLLIARINQNTAQLEQITTLANLEEEEEPFLKEWAKITKKHRTSMVTPMKSEQSTADRLLVIQQQLHALGKNVESLQGNIENFPNIHSFIEDLKSFIRIVRDKVSQDTEEDYQHRSQVLLRACEKEAGKYLAQTALEIFRQISDRPELAKSFYQSALGGLVNHAQTEEGQKQLALLKEIWQKL